MRKSGFGGAERRFDCGGPGVAPPPAGNLDFPLAPETEPDPGVFDFVVIGDVHAGASASFAAVMLDRVTQMNEMTEVPRVIIAVGDVVTDEEERDQWDAYLTVSRLRTLLL